jgi:hypothetical protein
VQQACDATAHIDERAIIFDELHHANKHISHHDLLLEQQLPHSPLIAAEPFKAFPPRLQKAT